MSSAIKLLNGEDIGQVIRWSQALGAGQVHAVLTAELRQIYHVQGYTTINVTSPTRDVGGSLEEYTLPGDTQIRFLTDEEIKDLETLEMVE